MLLIEINPVVRLVPAMPPRIVAFGAISATAPAPYRAESLVDLEKAIVILSVHVARAGRSEERYETGYALDMARQ